MGRGGRVSQSYKVEWCDLSKIRPYENNPRRNEKAIDVVANSIKEFGFRQPIVVDHNYVIIAGHTRYFAAKNLGLKRVPVHIADLTEEQARAYRLVDNKCAELSDWHYERLDTEIKSLLDNQQIDLSAFGFTDIELDRVAHESSETNQDLLPARHAVVIECESESEQKELITRMQAEGYECRALIL